MLSNWPIVILAIAVMLVGATLAYTNRTRPNGIAHNAGLIIMVNGVMMVGGLLGFAALSAFINLVRGL